MKGWKEWHLYQCGISRRAELLQWKYITNGVSCISQHGLVAQIGCLRTIESDKPVAAQYMRLDGLATLPGSADLADSWRETGLQSFCDNSTGCNPFLLLEVSFVGER